MQHYLYPAPLPPPLPPPPSGRGTILSQEARIHALHIAEEIQAERGSYRKWNEVAKEVNRQFGSNVDGDLVKRQVTSMLRSVQRSGLNNIKRPRKHAEVIQQLLHDPQAKRQCVTPLLPLTGPGSSPSSPQEGAEGEVINVDEERGIPSETDPASPRSESTSPLSVATTSTSTTSSESGSTAAEGATGELAASTTTATTAAAGTPATGEELGASSSAVVPVAAKEPTLRRSSNITPRGDALDSSLGDSHSIERVFQQRESKRLKEYKPPVIMPPNRILPTMTVDEVYSTITRLHPDIEVEFIRTQEIDGMAFGTLTHKDLTDFGVTTFGKRNKLLQLVASADPHAPVPVVSQAPTDFYYGRMPPSSFPSPFLEAKVEGGEKGGEKEGMSEKKPPVTKILDMEVVGVRKRYLIERENGAMEVLTPCKLRKYKTLTASFEHLHPDKLAPIPSFSTVFSHAPDDAKAHADAQQVAVAQAHAAASSQTPTRGSQKGAKGAAQPGYPVPAGYYPMYYASPSYPGMPPPNTVGHPSSSFQWVSTAYPAPSSARTPEKYHSFHPYTPPK